MSGAQTAHGRPGLGRIVKQPSASAEQASQPWAGKVEAGRAAGSQARGLGFAGSCVVGSHLEELDAAPCGLLAPLCSPHVLS